MADGVNRIANPTFTVGAPAPRRWAWSATSRGATWRWIGAKAGDPAAGVEIRIRSSRGEATWAQVVVCKPGKFYRVEATVSCELSPAGSDEEGTGGGCVLAIEPIIDDKLAGDRRFTPGIVRASEPIAVRAYYEVPKGVRRVSVSVGVHHAAGRVVVHDVRFIEILEPEEESHILAIPPPVHTLPAPRRARSVCVCSETSESRSLTRVLCECFGGASIQAIAPADLARMSPRADALLLPDGSPPPHVRSLRALIGLARERIVVVSLPAFAKLAGAKVSLRRVEQDDDPIHARVAFAHHATHGFALDDTFAYAWRGRTPDGFVQNQFRKTPEFKAFCAKHGFVTMLESMCDRDVTSERPVCLYRETPGGGLYVLDLDPVEVPPTTYGEPILAVHLLLTILGQVQCPFGQYVSAARSEPLFRDLLREMAIRFLPFAVHEPDLPIAEVFEQLVTIGRDDLSYGLPLAPKPVILVRSGLSSGDVESVYSALLWFKQLVRMAPHVCPYAEALASQYRLAWLPLVAEWRARDGWRRSGKPPVSPTAVDIDGGEVAAMIDIVSGPVERPRVLVNGEAEEKCRYAAWLPLLSEAFPAGECFTFRAADEAAPWDRDSFAWRRGRRPIEVVTGGEPFGDGACRDVLAGGGTIIRIEIPACDHDFTARSIERTDLGATLLEQVIGLQYGLLAVNRLPTAVTLDGFPPLAPGEALIVDRRDAMLSGAASRVG